MSKSNASAKGAASRAARALMQKMAGRFAPLRYATNAVVTSVQRDSAQRVIGATATVDGIEHQPVIVDFGAPLSEGDILRVENQGTPTATTWVMQRRIHSALAMPPVGGGATMPTPTGLAVHTGIVIGGEGPEAWLYASCNSVADMFGALLYRFEVMADDPNSPPLQITVLDIMATGLLAEAVTDIQTVIPHDQTSEVFARFGRIKVESEIIDYGGATFGAGDSGTGTGGTNSFTDGTKSWTTDQWAGFCLTVAGASYLITSNTGTVLTVVGTPGNGAYSIDPAFHTCTRGAGGSTAASHASGKTFIRRAIGTMLGTFQAGTDYNVRARSERPSDAAVSPWTAYVSVTTDVDETPPPDPTGLAITSAANKVILSWSGPTVETCPDLAGFEVYQATDASGTGAALIKVIGASLTTDVDAYPGAQWYYNLKAFDNNGNTSDYGATWVLGVALVGPGTQLLTNSDLERDYDVHAGIPDQFNFTGYAYSWSGGPTVTYSLWTSWSGGNASVSYGAYGREAGKGVRFSLDDDESGAGIWPYLRWVTGSDFIQVRQITAELGQPYTASIYFNTDVDPSNIGLSWDYDEGDDLWYADDGKLTLAVTPGYTDGTEPCSAPDMPQLSVVLYSLGDGWYRLGVTHYTTAADLDDGRAYVGFLFAIFNRTGGSIVVDVDRPMLEMSPAPSEWQPGLNPPGGGSSAGLLIDNAGIQTSDGAFLLGDDGKMYSHLLPSEDSAKDLGSSTLYWRFVYADEMGSGAATVGKVLTADGAGGSSWEDAGSGGTLINHDHSGDAGDGGQFDAANLTSGAATDGQVLTADGAGGAAWEDLAAVSHNLLSATHGDTLAATVAAGSLILGNATPKWSALALSAPAAGLRNVLAVDNGEALPSWKTALDNTDPTTVSEGAAAASGSSLVFARRDHAHGAPSTWAPTAHDLLSVSHGDTTGASGVRGDIITCQGATPKWARLAIATPAENVLSVLGVGNAETEPAWKTVLDATNPTTLTVSTSPTPGTAVVFAHRDHAHAITTASSPGAAASILASDSNGYLQLIRLGAGVAPAVPLHALSAGEALRLSYDVSNYASFSMGALGAMSVTTTGGGNLTIAPSGDIVFNPTGNDILPASGYDLNIGSLTAKYLSLHAAELWVETLVAQETLATIGGRILVGPTTALAADMGSSDAQMTVKHNSLTYNDTVYLEANGSAEFVLIQGYAVVAWDEVNDTLSVAGDKTGEFTVGVMFTVVGTEASDGEWEVASSTYSAPNTIIYVTGDILADSGGYILYTGVQGIGPYCYVSVTRNRESDPGGADDWYAGDAVFNTGYTGDGWIDLYSVRGVNNTGYGPTIVGNVRTSTTYNAWVEHWAIGNLNGLYGYSTDTYGTALGKYASGQSFLTVDATNGIRILSRQEAGKEDVGPDTTDTVISQWSTSGIITIGVTSAENVRVTSSAVEIRDGSTVYTNLAAGVLTLGCATAADGWYTEVAAAQIKFYERDTSASVLRAQFDDTSLKFYHTNGTTLLADIGSTITLYDTGGADRLVLSTSGVSVGDATEGDYVSITSSGVTIYQAGNAEVTLSGSGQVLVGQQAASQANVLISSGALSIRTNTTTRISLAADGSGYLANSNIAWDASGNATISGWTISAAAIEKSGHAGIISTTNAEQFWIKSSTFGNAGAQLQYNSGNPQFYIGNGSSEYMKYTSSGLELLTYSGTTKLNYTGLQFAVDNLPDSPSVVDGCGLVWWMTFAGTELGFMRCTQGDAGSPYRMEISTGDDDNATYRDFILQTRASGGTRTPLFVDASEKKFCVYGGDTEDAVLGARNLSTDAHRPVAFFDQDHADAPIVRFDGYTTKGTKTLSGYILVSVNGTDRLMPYYVV